LQIGLAQRQTRRTAVDNRAERRAMAFTEGRDREQAAKGVARHVETILAYDRGNAHPPGYATQRHEKCFIEGSGWGAPGGVFAGIRAITYNLCILAARIIPRRTL